LGSTRCPNPGTKAIKANTEGEKRNTWKVEPRTLSRVLEVWNKPLPLPRGKWGLVRLLVADRQEINHPEARVTAVPSSRDSKRDG
jgi:hypothetical protein